MTNADSNAAPEIKIGKVFGPTGSAKNGDSSWKKMVDESLHSDIENHLS